MKPTQNLLELQLMVCILSNKPPHASILNEALPHGHQNPYQNIVTVLFKIIKVSMIRHRCSLTR